jgi:hypothetical protein
MLEQAAWVANTFLIYLSGSIIFVLFHNVDKREQKHQNRIGTGDIKGIFLIKVKISYLN